MVSRRSFLQSSAVAVSAFAASLVTKAWADNAPGVTDIEIKIGQTMPYGGPASAYGVFGRAHTAYFEVINEAGGIKGRKLNLISVDDGYSPPKTVEQTRRLVEQERVAFIFGSLGTPTNLAIRSYLNDNKVPQLFISTGSSLFADPKHFPWTMGGGLSYQTEAHIFAKHILATRPDARIGLLYQNDGYGKDYLTGVRDTLGSAHAGMIVKEVTYEVTEPTVEFASRYITGGRRRHANHRCDPKSRRAGDPQGLRHRLDASAIFELSCRVDSCNSEARGSRKGEGADYVHLYQGRKRPALEGRSRLSGMGGVRGEVHDARRPY